MRQAKKTSKTARDVIKRAADNQDKVVADLRAAQTHDLSQIDAYNISTYERAALALAKSLTAMVERK